MKDCFTQNTMLMSSNERSKLSLSQRNGMSEIRPFKNSFVFFTGRKATEFAAMGFEMGILFHQLYPEFQKGDAISLINAINSTKIDGPRGVRNFHHDLSLAAPTIDIEKL